MQMPFFSASLAKKNGHIHNGKQNHRCLACGKRFVRESQQKAIEVHTKQLIRKTLLECIPLEGVCPVLEVSLPWLLETAS